MKKQDTITDYSSWNTLILKTNELEEIPVKNSEETIFLVFNEEEIKNLFFVFNELCSC